MIKYADADKAEVLSSDEHKRIESGLKKLGKRSVQDLDEIQRKYLLDSSE